MLLLSSIVCIEMHRVMIHREKRKKIVITLGDRLPRPMQIDIANIELFKESSEHFKPLEVNQRQQSTKIMAIEIDPDRSTNQER